MSFFSLASNVGAKNPPSCSSTNNERRGKNSRLCCWLTRELGLALLLAKLTKTKASWNSRVSALQKLNGLHVKMSFWDSKCLLYWVSCKWKWSSWDPSLVQNLGIECCWTLRKVLKLEPAPQRESIMLLLADCVSSNFFPLSLLYVKWSKVCSLWHFQGNFWELVPASSRHKYNVCYFTFYFKIDPIVLSLEKVRHDFVHMSRNNSQKKLKFLIWISHSVEPASFFFIS